jgi:hypothetical protein
MDYTTIPSCLAARWSGGLMVNDPARNPVTAGWNKVFVHYWCVLLARRGGGAWQRLVALVRQPPPPLPPPYVSDGGSFLGNNATVTSTVYNGAPVALHFRGRAILDAVFADLTGHQGLDSASDVVVGGDSAGGLATYWHIDHIADTLPWARVWGAPDCGFFAVDPTYPAWPNALRWIVGIQNGTGGLNAACVADRNGKGQDPTDCAFPQVRVRE